MFSARKDSVCNVRLVLDPFMAMDNKTVLVLGAGFTRAVVPAAPLIVDDYGVPSLIAEFANLKSAKSILERAVIPGSAGHVNLEDLLTRLMGLPYDTADARHELALVTSRLLSQVVSKIEFAKAAGVDDPTVRRLASAISNSGASVVTFNYDDVLDKALYELFPMVDMRPEHWHPDGGYGFLCLPSSVTVAQAPIWMNKCATLLLKLHGSVNWRCRLGDVGPRSPNHVLHHEAWFHEQNIVHFAQPRPTLSEFEEYLERDALIIPPVLLKHELTLHPVMRLVWTRARSKLLESTRVIFIGYSFPITDLAAKMLFQETLTQRTDVAVQVVDVGGNHATALERRYRELLNPIVPEFDFSGAKSWIENNAPGPPAVGAAVAAAEAAAAPSVAAAPAAPAMVPTA
jgi:hypothetical protein